MAYFFPGLIEQGNATARFYKDAGATPEQRKAIEEIATGKHGGGIFEIFSGLVKKWYPPKIAKMDLTMNGAKGQFKVEGVMQASSDVIRYPDGTEIMPSFTLPHGIEFKQALATNATTWKIHDEDLLATYQNKYCAVARVKFDQTGCIG